MTEENKNQDSVSQNAQTEKEPEDEVVSATVESSTTEQENQKPDDESGHEEIQALLEDARAKADKHFDQLVRLQAEMDNLRKRTKRDLESAHKFAMEKICQEMLPVRDSMEMGLMATEAETADLDTIRQGVDLTLQMFASMMDKFSMLQVNPEKGDKLNPELHQAMSMQEDAEVEPNTILTVVQKGYTLNGRLMRPAMVIVAKAATSGNDETKIGNEIDEQA